MKNKLSAFFSSLRERFIDTPFTSVEAEQEKETMPVLTKEDQERIDRGGRVESLAAQLVHGGNTYDFLFKPHKMEDVYSPAVVEARQRCLEELIKHASAYAACPQRAPSKDKGDFEPEI